MKKIVIALVVMMVSIACASSVFAFPLPFEFKMKMSDWEFFNPAVAPSSPIGGGPFGDGIEDNWGIANITQIFDASQPGAPSVWNESDSGEHLRIMFWGLDLTSWSGADGTFTTGPAAFDLGGGIIPYAGADLWLWDDDLAGYAALSVLIGNRTAFNAFTSVSGSNAGLQASFVFAPGIDFIGSLTKGSTTLIANPPKGHGAGYFDVIPGGAIGAMLDTNGFPTPFGARDVSVDFDFTTPGTGGFQLSSEDPILGSAVPEPTSIILLGLGMLGLAARRRKK